MDISSAFRTVEEVIDHQISWAESKGFALESDGRAFAAGVSPLFVQSLSLETIEDLTSGAGYELSRIHSLRSSSCLVLNAFEPWREDPDELAKVFGSSVERLQFEKKQPTGLKGVDPHLDVFLEGPSAAVGIESKFLEMYSPAQNAFSDAYFESEGLWNGMQDSRDLAQKITSGDRQFRWLHAAQLLKHAVGLQKNQQNDFRLVLVWYRLDGPVADEIESEIGQFTAAVSSEIDFSSMTYQELVWRLRKLEEPIRGHFDYLEERYRLDGAWSRQLPLLDMASQPEVNRKTLLDTTIDSIEPGELRDAYSRSVARAPRRSLRQKQYLVVMTVWVGPRHRAERKSPPRHSSIGEDPSRSAITS